MKTKSQYAQQRLHPKWQMRRLEIMKRDGAKCRECGRDDITLNVHHAYYVSNREVWDYPDFSLTTLCEDCHKEKHGGRLPDEDSAQYTWEDALDFAFDKNNGEDWEDKLWELLMEIAWAADTMKIDFRSVASAAIAHVKAMQKAHRKEA